MVNFKEKYHFSRFRRGSKFFQGGGGIRNTIAYSRYCFFPIETQITCDFSGGGPGPPAPSPLDPHLAAIYLVSQSANDVIASCTCARSPATSLYVFSPAIWALLPTFYWQYMALLYCPDCRNVNIRIVFIHHVTHLEFLYGITINAHLQHKLPSFSFLQTSCASLCPAFPWTINGFTKVKYFMDRANLPPCICLQQPNFSDTYGNRLTGQFDQSEITSSSRRPQLPLLSLCFPSIDRGKISASFALDLIQTSSSRSSSTLVVAVVLCFYLCFKTNYILLCSVCSVQVLIGINCVTFIKCHS